MAQQAQQQAQLSAAAHAEVMRAYIAGGEKRAYALGNRGPIRFDENGKLHPHILDAYWRTGFYVFEGVVGADELADLRADIENVLARAPAAPGADTDRMGRPALGEDCTKPPYRFAKPLSDPRGGTSVKQHP